jgi:hypothetical protein
VYDDFNNARPLAASTVNANQQKSLAGNEPPSPGYLSPPLDRGRKQQNRQTLIPSNAFEFDARNGDPQYVARHENSSRGFNDSTDRFKMEERDSAGMELITVPALGAEFNDQEVKAMKKPYKRRNKARRRGVEAQKWIKTDDRYCGCLSPRIAVFTAFTSLALLGVLLYFVIPRVPAIAMQTVTPLVAVPNGGGMVTHLRPTNFSMDMKVNLRADNTGGWIPTKVKKMDMVVYDITTAKKVGTGTLFDQSFPGRKRTTFQFPVSFAYGSINATGDATWLHWINACGPKCKTGYLALVSGCMFGFTDTHTLLSEQMPIPLVSLSPCNSPSQWTSRVLLVQKVPRLSYQMLNVPLLCRQSKSSLCSIRERCSRVANFDSCNTVKLDHSWSSCTTETSNSG